MKLEKHLEELAETINIASLREGTNPKEIEKYYYEMKKLNPKASPWIIFLGMADEIGISPPKNIDKYPNLNKDDMKKFDKKLKDYEQAYEKLLAKFPSKIKREIKNAQAPTGPFLPQKSGTEVAKEMGMTRQAVSSASKKGLPKAYQNVRNMYPKLNPFEAFMEMAKSLGMREQAGKLLRLMPKKIQDEIKKDATKFRK